MKRTMNSWKWLVSVGILLLCTVQISSAVQQTTTPSIPTATKSSIKPTTLPSTKPTRTATKTTKSSKVTSSKSSKSSASKEKTYTWKAVSSRPGCPTYVPTTNLVSRPFTAQDAMATQFIDLTGGSMPQQLGFRDIDNDTVILKTTNSSQIQIHKPGYFWMIIDNGGILVYDPQCQEGARLPIPNFFNITAPSNSSTTKESSIELRTTVASRLVRRAKSQISVYFHFIDQCGYRTNDNVTSGLATFTMPHFLGPIYRDVLIANFGGSGSSALYEAIVDDIPNIDPQTCGAAAKAITNFFIEGAVANVLDALALGSDVQQLTGKKTAGEEAVAGFLGKINLNVPGPWIQGAILAATALQIFTKHVNMDNFLCTMLGLDMSYELDILTEHYGSIDLDNQTAPYRDPPTKAVILPTKIHDPCTTTYSPTPTGDPTCQSPRVSPDPAAVLCPNTVQDYGGDQRCGDSSACSCGLNIKLEPTCFFQNTLLFCNAMTNCTSNDDCPCGSECLWGGNPCKTPKCQLVWQCRFQSLGDYYNFYGY